MKTRLLALLLLLSLAANGWLLWRSRATPRDGAVPIAGPAHRAADGTSRRGAVESAPRRNEKTADAGQEPKRGVVWREANTPTEWRALADELHAAGFPEAGIRMLVGMEVFRSMRAASSLAKLPFWHQFSDGAVSHEENEKLQRKFQAASQEVFGNRSESDPMDPVFRAARFGNLPDEKVALLNKIERDYGEIYWQQRRTGEGSDALDTFEGRARIRLLEEEKERDIAAMLTPEEFEDFERRQSRAARAVIQGVRDIAVSEEEYNALYQLQRRALAAIPRTAGPEEALAYARNSAASAEAVRAVLGDDRFYSYLANTDPLYGAAAKFAQANPGLSAPQTFALYQLQLDAVTAVANAAASGRTSDLANTPEGRAALAPFAAKLDALLGSQLAAAYRKTPQGKIFASGGRP